MNLVCIENFLCSYHIFLVNFIAIARFDQHSFEDRYSKGYQEENYFKLTVGMLSR